MYILWSSLNDILRNFPKSYNFHNRPVKVSKDITLNSNHKFVKIYKSTLEVKIEFIDPYFLDKFT